MTKRLQGVVAGLIAASLLYAAVPAVPAAAADSKAVYVGKDYTLFATPTKLPPLPDDGSYYPNYIYSFSGFHEGLVAVYLNNSGDDRKCGFMDKTGKLVIPMEYDEVGDFSEGLAWVSKAGKYGAIDKSGNVVIPLMYADVAPCREGLMAASLDGECGGYIDRDNNVVIPFEYDSGCYFSDGLAFVRKGNEWSCIDRNNNVVFYTECDMAYVFSEGFAVIGRLTGETDEYGEPLYKYGCVDKTGKVILPMEYDSALGFSEGLMAVSKGGRHGYVDTTGKVVIELQYEEASRFKEGVAAVAMEGFGFDRQERVKYIDKTGKTVFSLADVNEKAEVATGEKLVYWGEAFSDGLARGGGITELYMYFDKSGNMVLSGASSATNFSEGLALALGLYDSKGEVVSKERKQLLIIEKVPTSHPTASAVLVDGATVAFDAYNIGGNNYFKLRDLAYILRGTSKQFEVGWNGASNTITLTSGVSYTPVGGEMSGSGAGNKTPVPTTSKITLDGKAVSFTAYNIGGNNYFKLRDIGAALNFGVDWDGARNAVVIDTGKDHTTA
jgi:hypothetical protein